MIGRNDPCWCGSGKKWKKCHYPEKNPAEKAQNLAAQYFSQYGIVLKTDEEIAGIRRACRLAATILDATCKMARAGVTTNELNAYADRLHREAGARPAPLGFGKPPFPKSICTSLNEVICHGIPNDLPLMDGDIVKIDVSCELDGYYGDCCATVMIGTVSEEKRRVTTVSQECLTKAIEILKPGVMLNEIGAVIQGHAAKKGCSTVTQFVGHGIGKAFREAPQVPHHRTNIRIPLAAGMTFTIEPMINAGVFEAVIDANDGWTARTRDGRASAQWEHTLVITDSGYEVLTVV